MKACVILICMIIGSACVDLQRIAIGEDDLKSNTNMATKVASRAASPTSVETIIEDQHNLSRGVYADDASSKEETEASEKPTPVLTQTTVATEVKNSRRQRGYLGTRAVDRLWSLLKRSHRLISEKLKESHPRTSVAIRDTDSDSKRKTGGSLRRKKRHIHLMAMNTTRRHGVEAYSRIGDLFFLIYKTGMKDIVDECANKDKALIGSLVETGTVNTNLLNQYKEVKNQERKKFKEIMLNKKRDNDFAQFFLDGYNVMNDDAANGYEWDDYTVRRDNWKTKKFFTTPSAALDTFLQFKRRERDTVPALIEGTGPDIYEGPQTNEFEVGLIENSKNADFECPKKRREIDSAASKTHAQLFVIILCLVIGVAIVDLHWLEVSEGETEVNEKARKVKRTLPKTDRIGSAAERRIDGNSQIQT